MSQPSFENEPNSVEADVVEFSEELTDEDWAVDTSGPGLVARMLAELAGTFILVFMGVGAALFSGVMGFDAINVAFGFALGVIIAALIFAGISGAHLNPAVTVGLWLAGRFPARDVAPYVLAQVVGATAAAGLFYALRSTNEIYDQLGTPTEFMATASNGYADFSPTQFDWVAAGVVEIIIAALLVAVVLSVTARKAVPGFAPLSIGLTVGFLVLIAIPFTNGALNPARATGVILFSGSEHIAQLWLFWVAPLIGAAISGLLFRAFGPEEDLVTVEVVEVIED
ncbi:aquaporin [Demequina silvatica]|uniref:aquaporin n=1 Tax=Demequina silvatica TaxID=1638988 RepID=UPI000783669D|nr:aquaporin [Demequina silvatica]